MKRLIILCIAMLSPFFLKSQTLYNLYSLTIVQNDSIIWKGDCRHSLFVYDSIIQLYMDTNYIDFFETGKVDEQGWSYVKSFRENYFVTHYALYIGYFDEYFKKALLWPVDGKDRVLYSIIIQEMDPVNNYLKYVYTAYIN